MDLPLPKHERGKKRAPEGQEARGVYGKNLAFLPSLPPRQRTYVNRPPRIDRSFINTTPVTHAPLVPSPPHSERDLVRQRDADFVRAHFPNIYERLLPLGIDMTREPIPVVPAQHYTCGGVVVDLDGKTDAPGLYAAGEVTQSGLHGANRLASNSLLECLVFGEAAARHISAHWQELPEPPAIRAWDESRVTDSDEEVVITQTWGEIRRFMWNYVGIVRTTKRLERAKHRIDLLRQEVNEYYKNFRVTPDLIELRNLVEVADLIVRSALSRHESRGLHYTLDYPDQLPEARDTILVP